MYGVAILSSKYLSFYIIFERNFLQQVNFLGKILLGGAGLIEPLFSPPLLFPTILPPNSPV